MSFGATEDMILAGEAAINDVYTGDLFAQGDETERMGQVGAIGNPRDPRTLAAYEDEFSTCSRSWSITSANTGR